MFGIRSTLADPPLDMPAVTRKEASHARSAAIPLVEQDAGEEREGIILDKLVRRRAGGEGHRGASRGTVLPFCVGWQRGDQRRPDVSIASGWSGRWRRRWADVERGQAAAGTAAREPVHVPNTTVASGRYTCMHSCDGCCRPERSSASC